MELTLLKFSLSRCVLGLKGVSFACSMKLFTHAGAILAEPVLSLCHILKIVSIEVPQHVMQVCESEFKICSI